MTISDTGRPGYVWDGTQWVPIVSPMPTDALTAAEADALFLTPAEGDALFLTQAEGDALYKPTLTWTPLTLQNSWQEYGGIYEGSGYMKDAQGFVHLKGLIKLGSLSTIATLPVGYRVSTGEILLMAMASGGILDLRTNTTGQLNASSYYSGGSNGWVSLSGISFYVG